LVSIGLLSLGERSAVNNYLTGSLTEQEIEVGIEGFRSNIHRRVIELANNPVVSPEDSKAIESIYLESVELTNRLLESHHKYEIDQKELSHNTLRLVDAFEDIKESMNQRMDEAALAGRSMAENSQRYFAILAGGAVLFALLIGVTITRKITQPIAGLTRATEALAKGNLDHRVKIDSTDEIGQLGSSFNRMADDIHRFTEEIRQKSLQAELANQEYQTANKELFEALTELEKHSVMLKKTNKELEKATRLKSEFLANMSHELRTPMNSIMGFTNLVLRKSEETLDPKQKENLQKVLMSAEQLLSLINGVLDLSKIEAGKMDVHVEPFAFAQCLDEVKGVLSPQISEHSLKWVTTIDPSLPRIYSDFEKVRQILMNLLSNAVKFTPKGQVTLTINRILATLNGRPSTDCIEILIKDTGIGIAPKAQEIIFEDFRQADGSTTRKFGGTGLGLSICRRLCGLLGGTISLVESQVGKGSTFRAVLPIDYEIEKGIIKQRNSPSVQS
jgi:signal transduction histidine kinase